MKIVTLIPLTLTTIALAAYYSPWNAPDVWGGLYVSLLAILWLQIAWMFIPLHGWLAVRASRRRNPRWYWHALSAAAMCVLCSAFYIATELGYFISA